MNVAGLPACTKESKMQRLYKIQFYKNLIELSQVWEEHPNSEKTLIILTKFRIWRIYHLYQKNFLSFFDSTYTEAL